MANINYTKVSWDTTKSLGPTNLNHMDDGIKSVCDKMDNIGDEVMGYEVTSTGPSHQIINATNATNATNDGTGTNIANQFSELNNKITVLEKNGIGTNIPLTNNTDYVAPCDGYAILSGDYSGTSGYGYLYLNNVHVLTVNNLASNAYTLNNCYVRKGMTVRYKTNSTDHYTCSFRPIE